MTAPRFGVVVPVRVREPRHREDLAACLAALGAADPPPHEVVVVDDGSAPPVSLTREESLCARPLAAPPRGPASARNTGAAALDPACDVVVFVDADIVVPPDAFARLAEAFVRWPDAAAVWGTVTAAHPHPGVVSRYKNLSHRHFTLQNPARTRHLTSMLVAVRREVFDAVGGFDTTWDTVSVEDVELGRTLHAAGHAVYLDHDLAAEHRHRFTLAGAVRNDLHKVRRHVRTTLARRAAGCPSVAVEAPADGSEGSRSGERRQVQYLLGVPLGAGAIVALLAGRPLLAAGLTGALLVWERDFVGMLAREEGTPFALACVPLLVLERGVVAVATAAGVLDHLRASATAAARGPRSRPR